MVKKNTLLGIAEMGLGALLVSPIDEIAVGIGTGGISLPSAPAQLKGTAVVGFAMFFDGMRRL